MFLVGLTSLGRTNGQDCQCVALLDSLIRTIETNYPGFADKVTTATRTGYLDSIENARDLATASSNDSTCYVAVNGHVKWFKDLHLQFQHPGPPAEGTFVVEHVGVRPILEVTVRGNTNPHDPIEGIWDNGSYRLAIVPSVDKVDQFDAVVLSSTNDSWSAGDVKAKFLRTAKNAYQAEWIFGDRLSGRSYPASIVGDILDVSESYLAREWPAPNAVVDLDAYAESNDPTAPKLIFPEPDIALFSIPNFYPDNLPLFKSLLAKNAEALSKTPHWILDMRGNEGGDVRCGRSLLPYLRTGPIKQYNARARITDANVTQWWNEYIAETYMELDSAGRIPYDEYRNDLLAHRGELYSARKDPFEIIQHDSTYAYPRHAIILMDENCVSSGELFVMEARQSSKVLVLGTNSGGMIDYGDVLHYPMPCGPIILQLPSTRFNWLDEGLHVDDGGLVPDVRIDIGVDWIEAAKLHLQTWPRK